MKKLISNGVLMLVVLIGVVMVGCGSKGLSSKLQTQIKQDWQTQYGSELSIINYYGTHNDYVAFFMPGANDVVTNVKVAGTIFKYGNNWTIYLWKNGSSYDMIAAYQQGLLTSDNISKIGDFHRKSMKESWVGSESSFNEWYFDSTDTSTIIE